MCLMGTDVLDGFVLCYSKSYTEEDELQECGVPPPDNQQCEELTPPPLPRRPNNIGSE